MCSTHYKQWRKAVDGLGLYEGLRQGYGAIATSLEGPTKGTLRKDGYQVVSVNRKPIFEHRHVLEQSLGRPLEVHESVHHRNGVRHDNRLENLELWSGKHLRGVRVEDQVEWALEVLKTYRPDLLSQIMEKG